MNFYIRPIAKVLYFSGCLMLLVVSQQVSAQNKALTLSERSKENFDASWQFHKGDIAIKRAVKAGMQGGLADANVQLHFVWRL
ncbi:hypothetical protein [Mucilaginibacter sp. KACC 22063]|uniref:hypothetical protein n=1 Tax=Mucilaginibacter sp. KACC 22063 TaxID=3025666 RepID=UPI0023660A70|nr:hypothetical protein [Mucilaginibacter sp. KACC 22063]WDF57223.1 hypothetical protein PQ461_09175 [Mucilaginibacter sp. KACC 22063]